MKCSSLTDCVSAVLPRIGGCSLWCRLLFTAAAVPRRGTARLLSRLSRVSRHPPNPCPRSRRVVSYPGSGAARCIRREMHHVNLTWHCRHLLRSPGLVDCSIYVVFIGKNLIRRNESSTPPPTPTFVHNLIPFRFVRFSVTCLAVNARIAPSTTQCSFVILYLMSMIDENIVSSVFHNYIYKLCQFVGACVCHSTWVDCFAALLERRI